MLDLIALGLKLVYFDAGESQLYGGQQFIDVDGFCQVVVGAEPAQSAYRYVRFRREK